MVRCSLAWNRLWNTLLEPLGRWGKRRGSPIEWRFAYRGSLSVSSVLLLLSLSWLGLGTSPAVATDYNRAFLVGKDFSNKVLTDDEFTKANLRGADFSHSDLRGVRFFGTNLEDVNFTGANLSNATLDSARLVNANLQNAILEGAFAANVQFSGANIEGADFTDVLLRDDAQEMLCQKAQGVNPVTGRETRESLLCD